MFERIAMIQTHRSFESSKFTGPPFTKVVYFKIQMIQKTKFKTLESGYGPGMSLRRVEIEKDIEHGHSLFKNWPIYKKT